MLSVQFLAYCLTIDNQRNGLGTWAKALMLLMLHLRYSLVHVTVELTGLCIYAI